MDASRRSILKLFGVTAAATAVAVPAVVEIMPPPGMGRFDNQFELPFEVREGFTFNWKRVFVDGETPDIEHLVKMIASGWKPVPLALYRKYFPEQDANSYWIERGGLVLMEKPSALIPPPVAHPLPEVPSYLRGEVNG